MTGIGTIVNVGAILVAGSLGLLLKKMLSDRLVDAIQQALGLAVLLVGLSGIITSMFKVEGGVISSKYMISIIVSLAVGMLFGTLINIEGGIKTFSGWIESKVVKPDTESTFSQGFIAATLLFCIGAMSIMGAFEDGINNNPSILYAKSIIDAITAMVFASAYGAGVLLSALSVGIYQGLLTLLSIVIAPYLTQDLIMEVSTVGSVLIMSLGFNMLKIVKIKVENLLPAIFIPVLIYGAEALYHLIRG